jgi:hypothetical protein
LIGSIPKNQVINFRAQVYSLSGGNERDDDQVLLTRISELRKEW